MFAERLQSRSCFTRSSSAEDSVFSSSAPVSWVHATVETEERRRKAERTTWRVMDGKVLAPSAQGAMSVEEMRLFRNGKTRRWVLPREAVYAPPETMVRGAPPHAEHRVRRGVLKR